MGIIIDFPAQTQTSKKIPRQRVFYIGFRYIGPMLCQDIQQLYLKRMGKSGDTRRWSIITYGKYDDNDHKTYSIELEQCDEEEVPELLNSLGLDEEVDFEYLQSMGWNGKNTFSAEILNLP